VPVAASFRHTFWFGTVDRSTSPNVVIIVRTGDGAVG
jgi:muconate cycloisomerase